MKFNSLKKSPWVLFLLMVIYVEGNGQVSGKLYKDLNSNGSQNLPHEIGLLNYTVHAYLPGNPAPLSTLTNDQGVFIFSSTQIPAGTRVRVEFPDLKEQNVAMLGDENKSNIQFVTAGLGTFSSLGVLNAIDFCTLGGLEILTPCYVNGDPMVPGGSAGQDVALVKFPYNATGLAGSGASPYPDMLAKANQIGAVWGTAYQRTGKVFLVSAIVRRHSGLGSLGTGGIYKLDDTNGAISNFIDVKTLGIETGPDPHSTLNGDKLVSNTDPNTIPATGKTGIGGITLSEDEKRLFFINLYDRKLYSIYVGIPASTANIGSVKSYSIPNGCGSGEFRPWAVTEKQGQIYVGTVCSGENSQNFSELKGFVYKFDPTSGAFTQIFDFPLTYKKGLSDVSQNCPQYDEWYPWSNTFPTSCASFYDAGRQKYVGFVMYPQPILSGLGFDADGSLIIGIMDRFGLAAGYRNYAPVDDGNLYDGFVGGDLLRAQFDPLTESYTMESNGTSGSLTGCGVGNGEGPGGGEFFCEDVWLLQGNEAHNEITNGAVLVLPSDGSIISSAMDPVNEVYQSGGLRTYNRINGELKRGYALYSDVPGTLGKSGGTGDFKASCDPAPIEIGNRVWKDLDFDGIQDPEEPGIAGIELKLYDITAGNTLVGTLITNAVGEYSFNTNNVTGGLKYENSYEVRMLFSQSAISALGKTDLSPTDATSGTLSDLRDSDANLIGNQATATINTGFAGKTDFSLDFGITVCTPYLPLVTTTQPNCTVSTGSIEVTSPSGTGYTYSIDKLNFVSSNLFETLNSGTYKVLAKDSQGCVSDTNTVIINLALLKPTKAVLQVLQPSCQLPGGTIIVQSPVGQGFSYGLDIFSFNNTTGVFGNLAAGTYTIYVRNFEGCISDSAKAIINPQPTLPTKPVLNVTQPTCSVATGSIVVVSPLGVGFTYSLDGINFSNTTGLFNNLTAGSYTISVRNSLGCINASDEAVLTNSTSPTNTTASSNSPINLNGTIALLSSSSNAVSYKWAGPNGFTSNIQNPTIASAQLSHGGVYTLTATSVSGCTATATTNVNFLAGLGNYAWYDLNRNGKQDNRKNPLGVILGPEIPASGVVFELYKTNGTLVKKDTSDANGLYSFGNLDPSEYFVKVDTSSFIDTGFQLTNPPAVANDTIDNDFRKLDLKTRNVTLSEGMFENKIDLGIYRYVRPTIADPCACDTTIIYVKDNNYLYKERVDVKATPGGQWMVLPKNIGNGVTTFGVIVDDGSGGFKEINPTSENYFLIEDRPGIYHMDFGHYSDFGYALVVTDGVDTLDISAVCHETREQLDSRLDVVCAYDKPIVLQTEFPLGDAHYYFLADSAFTMQPNFNQDAIVQAAIAGGEITTLDPSLFEPNSTVSLYVKWIPTGTEVKGSGCPKSVFLNVKFDTQLDCFAQIGDYAWFDLNKNGKQDNRIHPISGANLGAELPAANIVISLHKSDGTFVAKDTTNAAGYYHFDNVKPGDFYIKFDPTSYPGPNYVVTLKNMGDSTKDNDIERIIYKSNDFEVVAGQIDNSRDVGLYRTSVPSIEDHCTCHDIVYDAEETYELLDRIIVEATPGDTWFITAQTGMQKIDSLDNYDIPIGTELIMDSTKPGKYSLRFAHDVSVGYSVTVSNGIDTLTLSNICSLPELLTNAPTDTVCAFEKPIVLSGKMILNNVDVTDGTIKFYTVEGFENYGTTGNPVYTQITQFDPAAYTAGDTVDIIAEYTPNKTTQCPITKWYPVVIAIEPSCLAQIGDFVWADENKNGRQDGGESGIANVSVSLLDAAGVSILVDVYGNSLLGKKSDALGRYSFKNLKPATYKVKFAKPTDYKPTGANIVVGVDTLDSDIDTLTGITSSVTLLPGEINNSVDAGYYFDEANCLKPAKPILSITQPTCTVPTGSIIVTSPKTSGYTYSINGIKFTDTTGVFGSLPAGNYSVWVKNTVGCVSELTTGVINPQPITPPKPILSIGQPTCKISTGTISVTIPQGAGLSYSRDGITFTNTSGIFNNLTAGNYTIWVKGATGCISDTSKATINIQPLSPNAGLDRVIYMPVNAAQLTPTPSGGTWSALNSNSFASGINNLGNVSGLSNPGDYAFKYTLGTCSDTAKVTVLCTKPTLTVGNIICNGSTYSVSFYSSATSVIPSAGTISGDKIINIPIGTDLAVKASYGTNCETTLNVISPTPCDPTCVFSNLSVGQPICKGTTYSVSYKIDFGVVSSNAGTVFGDSIVNIPIGTYLVVTGTNTVGSAICRVHIAVPSPESCLVNDCTNPGISVSGPLCTSNNTYSVNFIKQSDVSITSNFGTVSNSTVMNIPLSYTLTLNVSKPGCTTRQIVVNPPKDCSTPCKLVCVPIAVRRLK